MRDIAYKLFKEGVLYAPDYKDNRELPLDEQMLVEIIPFTNDDKKKYEAMVEFNINKKTGAFSTKENDLQRQIALKHIRKVMNYELFIPSEIEPIDEEVGAKGSWKVPSVEEFYDLAPPELVEDVLRAVQNRSILDDGKKNR